MKSYNIHAAKTQLSRLVDQAAKGQGFIIAKAGKPLVKVVAIDAPDAKQVRRIGFFSGHIEVPDHFNELGKDEIEALFRGRA